MTIDPCPIINVLTPSNVTTDIIATNIMIASRSLCIEGECIIDVNITWQNIGDTVRSFIPNISIDGIPIIPIYPSISIGAGSTMTYAFAVSGLTKAGSPHSICPVPN